MPKKGFQWTEKQTAIADRLRAGLSPQAVTAEGYNKKQVYRVKKELALKEIKQANQAPQSPDAPPKGETHIAPRFTSSVEVGQILIEPADWRVNQEGGLLVIGAYSHAKRVYGYNGTVGDFLCDCANLVRTIMGLDMVKTDYTWKEDNDRREEGDQGTGVLAEAGAAADGAEG